LAGSADAIADGGDGLDALIVFYGKRICHWMWQNL